MFTPSKSPFPMPMDRKSKFLTSQNPRSSRVLGTEKGKSKMVSLEESGADLDEAEVWKRFEEAGLLDESKLRWKDREALVERIQDLEKELYDYQYHMGLLLIEKDKQASEYEEMRQALTEADGIFNREQTAHMLAISEFQKREENFQKALMAEKQCVEDVKVQKLLGDLELSLDSKKQEFESELDKKRNSFEEDLKEKLDDMEKKKIEISYKEEQNLMREQLLEGKMQKLQDKEKERDANFRLLKEREESLYREEQKLKAGEVQLAVDIQKLVASKAEIESSRAAIYIEKQEFVREKKNLKSMQLEIKQEIDNCRIMKESLTTETEVFIHEKSKFDVELQVFDERRGALETERKQLNHDREAFNDWRCIEEEKLKSLQLKVKEEADSCRIMKESLMKETEELIQEKHEYDRMLDERKRALETELKQVNHDRKSFNDWRCMEEEKLRKMRIDIQQESEELRLRKEALEKKYSDYSHMFESRMPVVEEKEEKLCERENKLRRGNQMKMSVVRSPNSFDESNFPEETKRRKLENDQFEVQNADREQNNPVDAHVGLTKERDHFLDVAAQCKICRNCGVTASELDSTDLQIPRRSMTERNNHLEERKDGSRSVHLSGHFSSLRKCSVQFSSSPRETVGCRIEGMSSEPISFGEETSKSKLKYDKASSKIGSRDSKISERLCKDEPEASLETEGTYIRKREGELNVSFNDLPDKEDESKHQNLSAKQRGGHQNSRDQPDTIKDINSVRSIVEDSKAILEETSEEKELRPSNEKAKNVVDIDEGRHQGLFHADQKETSEDQKQDIYLAAGLTTGQLASKGDEVLSVNLSVGGSRKKRQTSVPGTPATGEKRYNFRRSTINRTRNFSEED